MVGRDAARLARVGLAAMEHRGIRSRVVDLDGAAVGHVRLPIVGVDDGHDQPVVRGPWTVGFVGEVLDFRERRPGAECDVDLVADTWADEGAPGFRGFDGFWSVVAHDSRDGSMHVLVDYLAQKPMYVRERLPWDGSDFTAVASEPDALVAMGPVELDRVYLSSAVKWGYCPETWRTPYSCVRRMLPGEHAVVQAGRPVELSTVDPLVPTRMEYDELRREIVAAVRRRVESSDVPVACLVSGGLDSAIVHTLARRFGDVRSYHVENGELEQCMRVAPDAELLRCDDTSLSRALGYMQEPVDLGSLVPQAALSDAVGRAGGERVCLTGDGADELFSGYGRAHRYDSQASDVWHELVGWHLPRLDRVMMRNRIEVRSPFLARRVAGAALMIPYSARMGKKVLRDLFRGDLPDGVADVLKRPLKTMSVEDDREARSRELVKMFTRSLEDGGMLCRG